MVLLSVQNLSLAYGGPNYSVRLALKYEGRKGMPTWSQRIWEK